jgi:hypothetical protein
MQYDTMMIKYLNDAAPKTHALEHLVEAQGDHQRLDGARVFGRAKGDADDHRVNHNAKLKNLQKVNGHCWSKKKLQFCGK